MTVESVFLPGVSGMGPALSPKGEAIVASKMVHRDAMLDELERKGLNVEALAHRHGHGCHGCGHDHGDGKACPSAECANGPAAASEAPMTLEEARARIARQEGEIAHLRHKLAVQQNQIFLLREALESRRAAENDAPQPSGDAANPSGIFEGLVNTMPTSALPAYTVSVTLISWFW